MRLLYSCLYSLAFLVALPYFLLVGLFRGKYLSTAIERLGGIRIRSKSCFWIHAVSVGEFLAAKPLIQALKTQFPEIPCVISTTTITGQELARKAFPGATFYFPFDWKWCMRRVFDAIEPRLILVMETEIWPNFLWLAQERKIPVLLINGRLSDRSAERYKRIRSWLPKFDRCLMQSKESAERMKMLSLSHGAIEVMGNLKFDFVPPSLSADLRKRLQDWRGDDLTLVAGSTMPGEEETLLQWFRVLRESVPLKLLLAPRHPERFEEVAALIRGAGLPMLARSENRSGAEPVFLLNSIGELAGAYEMADVAFIGGTLGKFGGHNPIEPAYFGKAIVTGTHYENFRPVYEEFQEQNAIVVSEKPDAALARLLRDADLRGRLGSAAAALVQKNRGATGIALNAVRECLGGSLVGPDSQLSVR